MGDGDEVRSVLLFRSISGSSCYLPRLLQSVFTIYRNLFARLGAEEALLSPGVNYPSFGDATWPWTAVDKSTGDQAKSFYAVWMNFATEKEFSWFDQWDLTEAPDRRVRRYVIFYSAVEFISR